MTSGIFLRRAIFSLLLSAVGVAPALPDSSHARIVRLSVVEGDVRFARDVHGHDPLADASLGWEAAPLNLPIRQGYVVSTDKGRAEVEFENGAMAFLGENTVVEFYDLSLEDGAFTTRLVLRQGSASFYVHPRGDDYFSVTGGDFTAEAQVRAEFRMDNFDDGSSVGVLKGHVNVLHKKESTALEKGQSLTVKVGDPSAPVVGRLAEDDDFDRWVSGRIDSVTTATTAALDYSSGSGYLPGYADLMTYGSWYSVGGYGYGWRPFGFGPGWCPFDGGGWYNDPAFGWTFIGNQPWGWLPYHYGSWLFEPGLGWIWVPGSNGFFLWRPSTGAFVRGRAGLLGLVPIHPLDTRGKAPVNLTQGVFAIEGGRVRGALEPAAGGDWKTVKSVPRETLAGGLTRAAAPERISRTLVSGGSGSRVVTLRGDSSIAYDAREHRFVNGNSVSAAAASAAGREGDRATGGKAGTQPKPGGEATRAERTPEATPGVGRSSRVPARVMTPPPPARSSTGGSTYSGGRGGSSGSRGSIAHPSGGASHPSGGRPH